MWRSVLVGVGFNCVRHNGNGAGVELCSAALQSGRWVPDAAREGDSVQGCRRAPGTVWGIAGEAAWRLVELPRVERWVLAHAGREGLAGGQQEGRGELSLCAALSRSGTLEPDGKLPASAGGYQPGRRFPTRGARPSWWLRSSVLAALVRYRS